VSQFTNDGIQKIKTNINPEEKYLTFLLADEEYGIGILKIREIIGVLPITSLPKNPSYIKVEIKDKNEVITMGILVDSVAEVISIKSNDIEKPPNFGGVENTDYIGAWPKLMEK